MKEYKIDIGINPSDDVIEMALYEKKGMIAKEADNTVEIVSAKQPLVGELKTKVEQWPSSTT